MIYEIDCNILSIAGCVKFLSLIIFQIINLTNQCVCVNIIITYNLIMSGLTHSPLDKGVRGLKSRYFNDISVI